MAETGADEIRVFRGLVDGKPKTSTVFAGHLNRPYGIAFYPVGPHPSWIYVGDGDAVIRLPYRVERSKRLAPPSTWSIYPTAMVIGLATSSSHPMVKLCSLPSDRVRTSMTPIPLQRSCIVPNILAFDPDGSICVVYASGIRNPSGLAIDPRSGTLWCTVNERDGLGDNLVPDYLTSVREGGFYGWPWWYIGAAPGSAPRRQASGARAEKVSCPTCCCSRITHRCK